MFKRIYATVTEKEFDEFRATCYTNLKKMGDVLTKLIHDYIETSKKIHKTQHHKSTGVDYKNENSKV